MFGNSHLRQVAKPCRCTTPATYIVSPRVHHFWDCILAQSLVHFFTLTTGTLIERHNLWLAIPPTPVPPAVHVGDEVWDVVCLAFVSALQEGWVLLATSGDTRPPCPVNIALAAVTASFWAYLSSFASLGPAILANWAHLPPTHPFLGWRDGHLVMNRL